SSVAHLHVDQRHIEWSHRFGPDDAVLVMAGLNDGGHEARRSDPVRSHRNEMFLAVRSGHCCLHRLRILGPEVDNMADFDAASRHTIPTRRTCPVEFVGQIKSSRNTRHALKPISNHLSIVATAYCARQHPKIDTDDITQQHSLASLASYSPLDDTATP